MFEILGIMFLFILFFGYFVYAMNTDKHGAPFVPMEPEVVERVMEIAKIKAGDTFYELGSGDGRLVIAAALRGAEAIGVEIDFLRVWYSRVWIYLLRIHKNAKIWHQNFFEVNFTDADIICTYLLERTNEKLEEKLKNELKIGTRVVSVGFRFPDWKPIKIDPYGTIYGPIYLYMIGKT